MLKEDAWRILQVTQKERIYMGTGQYPRRRSGAVDVNRRKLSSFGHAYRHA